MLLYLNPRDNERNLRGPKNHEDHVAGEGFTSMSHYNLVHKFIPMPQAMKIKAAVDKEWKELETMPSRDLTKVKSKRKSTLLH